MDPWTPSFETALYLLIKNPFAFFNYPHYNIIRCSARTFETSGAALDRHAIRPVNVLCGTRKEGSARKSRRTKRRRTQNGHLSFMIVSRAGCCGASALFSSVFLCARVFVLSIAISGAGNRVSGAWQMFRFVPNIDGCGDDADGMRSFKIYKYTYTYVSRMCLLVNGCSKPAPGIQEF